MLGGNSGGGGGSPALSHLALYLLRRLRVKKPAPGLVGSEPPGGSGAAAASQPGHRGSGSPAGCSPPRGRWGGRSCPPGTKQPKRTPPIRLSVFFPRPRALQAPLSAAHGRLAGCLAAPGRLPPACRNTRKGTPGTLSDRVTSKEKQKENGLFCLFVCFLILPQTHFTPDGSNAQGLRF